MWENDSNIKNGSKMSMVLKKYLVSSLVPVFIGVIAFIFAIYDYGAEYACIGVSTITIIVSFVLISGIVKWRWLTNAICFVLLGLQVIVVIDYYSDGTIVQAFAFSVFVAIQLLWNNYRGGLTERYQLLSLLFYKKETDVNVKTKQDDIADKLRELKNLLDEGLITQEDYSEKKKDWLEL